MIVLLADGDEENTLILVNDLDNSRQLLRADVLFVRFVDIRTNTNPNEDVAAAATVKATFHELVGDLKKIGERRNELVQSRYMLWTNVRGGKKSLKRSYNRMLLMLICAHSM